MALTATAQVATATPATDQMTLIKNALTAAGWTYIGEKTAATMGTTAAVKCFASPSTVVASNVYTGCVIFVEYDDANSRLRFRVAEWFDDAATGAPATNVKWTAPGNNVNTAQTPNANYSFPGADTAIALFQAAGASQKVGWVNIPVTASGFYYILGANSNKLVYANNTGGNANSVMAGHLEYLGNSGGSMAVFLYGNNTGTTTGNHSWTAASGGNGAVFRVSREPLMTAATTTAFAFFPAPQNPFGSVSNGTTEFILGAIGTPHQWLLTRPVFDLYLHGIGSVGLPYGQGRALLASVSDVVCELTNTSLSLSNAVSVTTAFGDEVTIDGNTYTSLGVAQVGINGTTRDMVCACAFLVKGSAF